LKRISKSVSSETRNSRKKQTAEVFTPQSLVIEMLKKLPKDSWNEDKTFCDPSAGNGNFLVIILKAKLKLGHDPLKAISTIFGVELMSDNVIECRHRLFEIIKSYITDVEQLKQAAQIIQRNIISADALSFDWENHWK
jgi:hypothetical protein